jgi:hypothetical protein
MQQRKTGTGGARAPLSEILPYARVARFGQDDTEAPRKRRYDLDSLTWRFAADLDDRTLCASRSLAIIAVSFP